jgi:hypothetical protein
MRARRGLLWISSAIRTRTPAVAVVVALLVSSCTGSPPRTASNPPSASPVRTPTTALRPPAAIPITWKPQVRLTYHFGQAVGSGDRTLIRSALKQAIRLFPYPHPHLITPALIAVFVHTRNGEMTRPNEIAGVRPQSIHVFVGSAGWRDSSSVQRREAMFHEWIHIVQQLESPSTQGPVWLVEGTAEWAAWDAVIRLGLASRDAIRSFAVQGAARVDLARTLHSMEGQGFYKDDADGRDYTLAYLAVDFLHPRSGWKTIVTFYRVLGEGTFSWRTAFRRVFRISTSHFYSSFEADRLRGFSA